MKKFILLLFFIIPSFLVSNQVFADSSSSSWYLIKDDVNIYKIYKETILSRHKISKDFVDWKEMNSKIEKFFISLYFTKDRKQTLVDLEKNFRTILEKYEDKKLSNKEVKVLNLVKNLYLRTILELRKK